MKFQAWALLLFTGLGSADELDRKTPQFNFKDQRFTQYKAPGPNDSRSPCPGLNTLANHGFLPHNGRNVNIVQLITGAFLGLGVDPGISAVVGAIGYASSHNIFSLGFDLEDLRNHLFLIEHDCSFSREDAAIGNNNVFHPKLWKIVMAELKKNKDSKVTPGTLGRGKAARIEDALKRNPKSVYGPRSAAFGAIEVGLIMSALGPLGTAPLSHVRSFFEEERMPTHLGWKPRPLAVNLVSSLAYGVVSLASDPHLIKHAGGIIFGTPGDVLGPLFALGKKNGRKREDMMATARGLVEAAGFNSTGLDEVDAMMADWTPPKEWPASALDEN